MKRRTVAIDFDGVITDLDHAPINVSRYLSTVLSIGLAKPNHLISPFLQGLAQFCNLYVLTSRPKSHLQYIHSWLVEHRLRQYLSGLISSNGAIRGEVMLSAGIHMLVDDEEKNFIELATNQIGIKWKGRDWSDVLAEILTIERLDNGLKGTFRPEVEILSIEHISELGASPVFVVTYADSQQFKFRICCDEDVARNIRSIVEALKGSQVGNIPRTIFEDDLILVSEFILGQSIAYLSHEQRKQVIAKIGKVLAKLVSVNFSQESSGLAKFINLCSIDRYNVIVDENLEPYFIDLEHCKFGPKWLDLIWAERLLCQCGDDIRVLHNGYLSVTNNRLPTEVERQEVEIEMEVWLHHLLLNSASAHYNNINKYKVITQLIGQLGISKFDA